MRIEVLIGNEDPIIYPLKSNKMTIGSGESCDVILSASGISRKHLTIMAEDDQYFVIDQGSTNGTFINEERLIPGKKVEFTSFFPVRLGDNVLVSLLSDEEGTLSSFDFPKKEPTNSGMKMPERGDATTVINLKDLKKVRTEDLVLERNQKREIRKKAKVAPPPPPKKKINYVAWICGLIVVVAGYYNFFVLDTKKEEKEIREVGKIIAAPEVPQKPAEPAVNENLVPKDLLPTKEYVNGLLTSIKCAIDVEIYLCDIVPNAKGGSFGAVQVGLANYILVDGTPYIEEAKKYVVNHEDKALIGKTAAYIFLMRYLPILDENIMGESRLGIGLFLNGENGPVVDTVIALKPKVFNQHKNSFGEDRLRRVKELGHAALMPMESLYTVL